MEGVPWNNIVAESKKLLDSIQKNHIDPSMVELVLIFFNSFARVVYQGNLNQKVSE